nr:GNAT family N-acetyltransferase [Actinomycetales bacterium]
MRIRPGRLEDSAAINRAGLRINTRVRPEAMVVAEEEDGSVLGFAYIFRSNMHPSRYWATVRVREERRREGLGTRLISEVAKERQVQAPFYFRGRENDPAVKWLKSLKGREFQTSPPMELPLTDERNQEWFRHLPGAPAGVDVVPASALSQETILEAFLDTYRWVHEQWSRPASREYVASVYGPDLQDDLDQDISSFAVRGLGTPEQEVLAGIWSFHESLTTLDAVGESVLEDDPDADQLVAAVLNRTVAAAAEKGFEALNLDGYATDRHMYPLERSAPTVTGTGLVWIEYDPPEA